MPTRISACFVPRLVLIVIAIGLSASPAYGQSDPGSDPGLLSRLVEQLGSGQYHVRENAEKQLRGFSDQLPEMLQDIPSPTSVEARIRIKRILKFVRNRGMTEAPWKLTTWPLEGEDLDIAKEQVIRFFESGTFTHSGGSGKEPETWQLDKKSNQLRMSFNGEYAVYEGTFNERGEVIGKAVNIKDKKWNFRLAPNDGRSRHDADQ